MIDRNEIEEVIESFGLKKEDKGNFIYGGLGEFCALIYYKENCKACVYEYNNGFSNNLNNKRAIIWKMKQLFKDMKEAKLRRKLERMKGDFE
jgi:hypothetical protein